MERPRSTSLILIGFTISLVATLALGLLLRWQLAGLPLGRLDDLDLRRAHSHLGFYGVLFPAAWIAVKSVGDWIPGRNVLLAYLGLVAVSSIGFLLGGYGPLTIAASTGILLVWLAFAAKNWPGLALFGRSWQGPAFGSILLTAALIPLVAVSTSRDPGLANQVARAFLAVLLFGVFVPAALRARSHWRPVSPVWFGASALAAAQLTGLVQHPIAGTGLLWLAYAMTRASSTLPLGLRLHWWALSVAFAAVGIGLLPFSPPVAIAGIHFLVLGPILLTLARFHLRVEPSLFVRSCYEAALVVMVTCIALPIWLPGFYFVLNKIAFVAGFVIFIAITALALSGVMAARSQRVA